MDMKQFVKSAIHVSNSKVQNYQESGGVIYSNLNVTLQGYLVIKMKWNF